MLRTVRIVQVQQRRLRKRVRLALRHRVLRIAVHLDRPERVRLDQHRNRARRERIRRRKVHRLAQDQILGLLHVGKIGSSGCLVQPARPASASDAPITFRKPRRDTASTHSPAPACRGNSSLHHLLERRASPPARRGSSRSACRVLPSSFARTSASVIFAGAIAVTTCALSSAVTLSQPSSLRFLFACRLHRWHVSQLESSFGVRMWYCAVRYLPRSIWLVNFGSTGSAAPVAAVSSRPRPAMHLAVGSPFCRRRLRPCRSERTTRLLARRALPRHVVDLAGRPQVHRRIAMAVQAPLHLQRVLHDTSAASRPRGHDSWRSRCPCSRECRD